MPAAATGSAEADDALLRIAENLVGEALFLRGFYYSNNLVYDADGRLEGLPQSGSRTADWTLSGINILKATRKGADAIELDGVRVAIRYNPDAHEFQRHPLTDDKVKVVLHLAFPPTGAGTVAAASLAPVVLRLRGALANIFAIGIDPALQRSMPPLWRHYFDPSLPWPATSANDPLVRQPIYNLAPIPPAPNQPGDIVAPRLIHQVASEYTPPARHDNVKGQVQLRMVVDAEGMPQRIAVTRPLGYGLELQADEAMRQWRFSPGTQGGKPVATGIL